MPTFESVYSEYLKLRRPHFVQNNPHFPMIFSAAAVSLATQMLVDGNDLNPAVWYVALIGTPRSGKTSFLRTHTYLLSKAGLPRIPEGSPEAMLNSINEIRHGYIFFDEVSRLAKLMKSYMGVLPTLLNLAYYLDTLNQNRTDAKKKVIVPANSYFLHTYFAGTREDWASVEMQAPGGFVRRTLILPTRGIIPFFEKAERTEEDLRRLARLESHIVHVLRELKSLRLTVSLPGYPSLKERIEKAYLPLERKSMVEEYTYKLIAGRLVANLIEVPLSESPEDYQLNEILNAMERRAEEIGIKFMIVQNTPSFVEVILKVPRTEDDSFETVDQYLLPNLHKTSFDILMRTTREGLSVPDEAVADNLEKIRDWLGSGGSVVVSKTTFIQRIFHSRNFAYYDKLIALLEEGGYIRQVQGSFRGRPVNYIVLDPSAKICANCALLGTKKCPRVVEALSQGRYFVVDKDALVHKACDKFEPVGDDES